MWYAEYWDDEWGEYVSVCLTSEDDIVEWCKEHGVDTYEDDDGNLFNVL